MAADRVPIGLNAFAGDAYLGKGPALDGITISTSCNLDPVGVTRVCRTTSFLTMRRGNHRHPRR